MAVDIISKISLYITYNGITLWRDFYSTQKSSLRLTQWRVVEDLNFKYITSVHVVQKNISSGFSNNSEVDESR